VVKGMIKCVVIIWDARAADDYIIPHAYGEAI
jgi:hypothetical protein